MPTILPEIKLREVSEAVKSVPKKESLLKGIYDALSGAAKGTGSTIVKGAKLASHSVRAGLSTVSSGIGSIGSALGLGVAGTATVIGILALTAVTGIICSQGVASENYINQCGDGFSKLGGNLGIIGSGLLSPIDTSKNLIDYLSGEEIRAKDIFAKREEAKPAPSPEQTPSTSSGGASLPLESKLSEGFKPLYLTLELPKTEEYIDSNNQKATRKVTAVAIAGWRLAPEGTSDEVVKKASRGEEAPTEDAQTLPQKAINLVKKGLGKLGFGGGDKSSGGASGGASGGTTGTGTAPSPAPEAKPSTNLAQKAAATVKKGTDAVRNAFKPSAPTTNAGRVAPLTTSTPGTSVATNPSTGISTVTTDVSSSPTTGIGPAAGAPDTAPGVNPSGSSGGSGGSSGGFSATPSVKDVVECPAGAIICARNPGEGKTVPKAPSITLNITTRVPMSCRYSQTNANFNFDEGTKFLEDITPQQVNDHTDFLYNFNEGSYTFYHQCKDANGTISSLTHKFSIGPQDLSVEVTCTNLKGEELEVCLKTTATDGADTGKKEIDLAINKDGKTVKIVRLGTEITPEVAAPQQTGKAVVWIVIMMVLLSGVLGFLFWRYKHLKNIEEESVLKQDAVEIPQTQSAIAYMFGI